MNTVIKSLITLSIVIMIVLVSGCTTPSKKTLNDKIHQIVNKTQTTGNTRNEDNGQQLPYTGEENKKELTFNTKYGTVTVKSLNGEQIKGVYLVQVEPVKLYFNTFNFADFTIVNVVTKNGNITKIFEGRPPYITMKINNQPVNISYTTKVNAVIGNDNKVHTSEEYVKVVIPKVIDLEHVLSVNKPRITNGTIRISKDLIWQNILFEEDYTGLVLRLLKEHTTITSNNENLVRDDGDYLIVNVYNGEMEDVLKFNINLDGIQKTLILNLKLPELIKTYKSSYSVVKLLSGTIPDTISNIKAIPVKFYRNGYLNDTFVILIINGNEQTIITKHSDDVTTYNHPIILNITDLPSPYYMSSPVQLEVIPNEIPMILVPSTIYVTRDYILSRHNGEIVIDKSIFVDNIKFRTFNQDDEVTLKHYLLKKLVVQSSDPNVKVDEQDITINSDTNKVKVTVIYNFGEYPIYVNYVLEID